MVWWGSCTEIVVAEGRLGWEDSIQLRHLVALLAVATERSFGRAAEHLGYTQSAVSQQIAALERIVGEPLFDRPGGPKPVSLTEAGERLVVHAEAILNRVRIAELDLRELSGGRVGRLAVGTFQSVSIRILPGILGRLRVERPGVTIDLVELNYQPLVLEQVAAGELDLAFVVLPLDPANHPFETLPLIDDPYVVLASPREGAGSFDLTRLEDEPLVGLAAQTCQIRLENEIHHHGIHPTFGYRFDDNAAVQAMVRNGMGRAVMPLLAVDVADPGTVLLDPVPALPPRRIGLAWSGARHRSTVSEVFARTAREECARLAADSASDAFAFTVPAP